MAKLGISMGMAVLVSCTPVASNQTVRPATKGEEALCHALCDKLRAVACEPVEGADCESTCADVERTKVIAIDYECVFRAKNRADAKDCLGECSISL